MVTSPAHDVAGSVPPATQRVSRTVRVLTVVLPAASRAPMVSLAPTLRWRRSPRLTARRARRGILSVSVLRAPRVMKLSLVPLSA